jgi:periplasmic protein TonB
MKQANSYSLYALIIAFLVHIIVVLLLVIFNLFSPKLPKQSPTPPQEQRFKLSLKETPRIQKEALVKNDIPKITKTPSIPRGEQLKKITPPAPKQPTPEPVPTPAEPKKAFVPHEAKKVATISRETIPTPPKKEQGLYDILSRPDPSARSASPRESSTRVNDNIQRLYGDKFNELSAGEQKYIIDNQETMRRITQGVLDRYGSSKIPNNIRINDTNMIEFYLYPDGSISDMRILKNSQLSILDDTTKETIELAYAKYPRPEQKTLIRYRVWYNLTGY